MIREIPLHVVETDDAFAAGISKLANQLLEANAAGLIVLHVKRSPSSDRPDVPSSIEIPVYVEAASVVTVEPSVRANGTMGGAIVEVRGGARRYVVESAEAVVSLLARMRDLEASRGE